MNESCGLISNLKSNSRLHLLLIIILMYFLSLVYQRYCYETVSVVVDNKIYVLRKGKNKL